MAAESLDTYAAAWAEGWSRTRGTPAPVAVRDGFRIAVGGPDHHGRYVVSGLDGSAIRRLSATVATPSTYIKALAAREPFEEVLPPEGWSLQAPEFMMTAGLDGVERRDPPRGYLMRESCSESVVLVEIVVADGTVAATGKAAMAGRYAVFDQIVTELSHRRRGLGGRIMDALAIACRQRGADQGLLVATEEGRLLYEALGWRIVSPVVSLLRN